MIEDKMWLEDLYMEIRALRAALVDAHKALALLSASGISSGHRKATVQVRDTITEVLSRWPDRPKKIREFINPWTRLVNGSTEEQAIANIAVLVNDANLQEEIVVKRDENADDGGRFGFVLSIDKRECTVDMPGLPIDRVRFVDNAGLNPFAFPRIYVNDSSWLWCIGVDVVRQSLSASNDVD